MKALALLLGLLCPPVLVPAEGPGAPDATGEVAGPYEGLVDEDEQYAPPKQTYAFNPVQAQAELKVGIYYSKKGSHRAAAGRYLEATRWDEGCAEAYWRLGMAREKLGQRTEAIDAYIAYLGIEPGGKKAREIGRRLERLREQGVGLPLTAQEARPGTSP